MIKKRLQEQNDDKGNIPPTHITNSLPFVLSPRPHTPLPSPPVLPSLPVPQPSSVPAQPTMRRSWRRSKRRLRNAWRTRSRNSRIKSRRRRTRDGMILMGGKGDERKGNQVAGILRLIFGGW